MADCLDDLVIQARTDGDALGRLYEEYYDRIFRYCMHRLYRRTVAEDVTSTVFLKVARHIRRFDGGTETVFRSWLYAIATNEINGYIRKAGRRRKLLEAACLDGTVRASEAAEPAADPDVDWPALYSALLKLKPKQQTAVTLRYFEGLKTDEIAEILRMKPVATRVMLSRALDKLRDILSPREETSQV